MNADEMIAGASYACKYTDLAGKECIALVTVRDRDRRMLMLKDLETGIEFSASYDDVRELDRVEWQD